MRKFLAMALVCLSSLVAHATKAVTGNVKDLTGTAVTTRTQVVFDLINTGGNIPKINGTTTIVPVSQVFTPNGSGVISGSIYGNDEIKTDVVGNTRYRISILYQGVKLYSAVYNITGAFDLNTATPSTVTATITPPTGDTTYQRLDGGNNATGPYSPAVDGTALGNSVARWNGFFSGSTEYSYETWAEISAPVAPAAGSYRIYSKTGTGLCQKNSAGTEKCFGAGTVTSVGLSSDADWMAVGSTPVITSGTITMNRATGLAANQVLATPDGSTGTVGRRALVGGDLPNPAVATKGGVQSKDCSATTGGYVQKINTDSTVTCATGFTVLDKQDIVAALNGNSADQTLYTYTMPSGTLAAGKCLSIFASLKRTVGAGAPAEKLFFGATQLVTNSPGAAGPYVMRGTVCNNASSSTAQWGLAEFFSPLPSYIATDTSPAESTSGGSVVIKATFNIAAGTSVAGTGWMVVLLP